MKKLKSLIGLSFAFSLVTFTTAFAMTPQQTPSIKVPKPECRLQVDNAHISSTLLNRRNVTAVKVNVYSICNRLQTQVKITLRIYKTQRPADRYYGPFVNSQLGGRNSGLTVEMQDKFVICKNSIPTEWFGVAYAKAFIDGKWQYAGNTRSPKKEIIECGT
jgi:hypothetical protein